MAASMVSFAGLTGVVATATGSTQATGATPTDARQPGPVDDGGAIVQPQDGDQPGGSQQPYLAPQAPPIVSAPS